MDIDVLGDFLGTSRRNTYLLVIIDRFSKLVWAVLFKKKNAGVFAEAFVRHQVLVYGPSITLVSHNRPQYVARLFQDVFRVLGVKSMITNNYQHHCSGHGDRFNRTLLPALRARTVNNQELGNFSGIE